VEFNSIAIPVTTNTAGTSHDASLKPDEIISSAAYLVFSGSALGEAPERFDGFGT
jgi:hypothetical protein